MSASNHQIVSSLSFWLLSGFGAEVLLKQLTQEKLNDWLLSDLAAYYLEAVALLQTINSDDAKSKVYAAQALLYTWKPVVVLREEMKTINNPFNSISDANTKTTQEIILTPDFCIPDISKTYIYKYTATVSDRDYNRQKTVKWSRKGHGLYERAWDAYEIQADGSLFKYGLHGIDKYQLTGSTIEWISNTRWADQAGGGEELLVSGKREIQKQVAPGKDGVILTKRVGKIAVLVIVTQKQ